MGFPVAFFSSIRLEELWIGLKKKIWRITTVSTEIELGALKKHYYYYILLLLLLLLLLDTTR